MVSRHIQLIGREIQGYLMTIITRCLALLLSVLISSNTYAANAGVNVKRFPSDTPVKVAPTTGTYTSGNCVKFDANGIVTGTKDGISQKGLWVVDIAARTISSSFLTAGPPVNLLNETWKITDSYTDRVIANSTDTVNNTSNTLELRKQ